MRNFEKIDISPAKSLWKWTHNGKKFHVCLRPKSLEFVEEYSDMINQGYCKKISLSTFQKSGVPHEFKESIPSILTEELVQKYSDSLDN